MVAHSKLDVLVRWQVLMLSATLGLAYGCRSADAPASTDGSTPLVIANAEIVDGVRGRPPHYYYQLELKLRNPSAESRWLLWPQSVPHGNHPHQLATGTLIHLNQIELSAAPKVTVVSGLGANFWAVHLPGYGQLTLSSTHLTAPFNTPGTTPPEMIDFEVIVASAIQIDGEPIEAHLMPPITSASDMSVIGPESPFDDRGTVVWPLPAGRGVVKVVEESREKVAIRAPRLD